MGGTSVGVYPDQVGVLIRVIIEVPDWVLVPGSGSAVLSSGGGGSGGGLGVVGNIQGADRVDVRREWSVRGGW